MDAIRVIPTPTSTAPWPAGDRLTTPPPVPSCWGHGSPRTARLSPDHPHIPTAYYYRYCRLKETRAEEEPSVRIRAERDDLADVLARAGRAVSNRSPLPILQGILCEVSGNQLRVTGTDSEVTIRTALEVEAIEEGRTLVPAKLAAEAVRKLPVGAVTMASADGHVEITGNGPRFRLRELSVDDYPVSAAVPGGSGLDLRRRPAGEGDRPGRDGRLGRRRPADADRCPVRVRRGGVAAGGDRRLPAGGS